MVRKTGIKILGVKSTIAALGRKQKGVDKGVKRAMEKISLFEEANVKRSIAGQSAERKSVDTGRFLNSVRAFSDDVSATVASSVEYSIYLEMGTRKLAPRRHFQNTLARDKEKIQEFLKTSIFIELR